MANQPSLLELVDILMANSLRRNLYTDVQNFSNSPKDPLSNIVGGAHPHANSNVIPVNQSLHGPPSMTRDQIYKNDIPPNISEYIGDSLFKLNDNFQVLDDQLSILYSSPSSISAVKHDYEIIEGYIGSLYTQLDVEFASTIIS